MSRVEMMPIAGLRREGEHEALPDVKPMPWLYCALVILLASALSYGLGYFVIALLIHRTF